MTTIAELCDDLAAEHEALDAIVRGLAPAEWARPTPSPGWSVADQLGHLAFFDRTGALAVTDPEAFEAHRDDAIERMGAAGDTDFALDAYRAMDPAEVLADWRMARRQLVAAARELDPADRVPWYGPPMGALSFVTSRLMETWAHGQDVVDAVGAEREPTARLRHIAHMGVITRGWTYLNRGLPVPDAEIEVALVAPDGSSWHWGPEGAADRVGGDAVDFCLVVTQRRNVADLALEVRGPAAIEWMGIAQAFAGKVTDPPAPRGHPA